MTLTHPSSCCALLQVSRTEPWLDGIVQSLYREGVRNFFFAIPQYGFDGRVQTPEDQHGLNDVMFALINLDCQVDICMPAVLVEKGETKEVFDEKILVYALNKIKEKAKVKNGWGNVLTSNGETVWERSSEIKDGGHWIRWTPSKSVTCQNAMPKLGKASVLP